MISSLKLRTPYEIDDLLACSNRTLRTFPERLLCSPTGNRLWADTLLRCPGFQGTLDFIQKLNLPLLFTVEYSCGSSFTSRMDTASSVWRPSYLSMHWEGMGLAFDEEKYITADDVAVSLQHWTNLSDQPVTLRLRYPSDPFGLKDPHVHAGELQMDPSEKTFSVKLDFIDLPRSFAPSCLLAGRASFDAHGELKLSAGESVHFALAAAAGLPGMTVQELMIPALRRLGDGCGKEALASLLDIHRQEYLHWFSLAPSFTCDDPLLEKTWWYRWYILRANYSAPCFGNFTHGIEFEGRSHRMPKTPYSISGWEFSKLIPLSTPMHIREMRHMSDSSYVDEVIRTLAQSGAPDGAFSTMEAVGTPDKEYSNDAAFALLQYYESTGDRKLVDEVLPAFERNFRAVYARHQTENDHLQIEAIHALTGKEYQPSYWYFGGFPKEIRASREGYTPLKRVDRSIDQYQNAYALSRLCAICGRDGSDYAELAEQMKKDILEKMWDADTAFFYDLHPQTDEKAMVKNVVGAYPYLAEITASEHLSGVDTLLRKDLFCVGSAFASTAADCPIFRPEGSWQGNFFKGRDGCMWDGPSWPFTTAIALDAIARTSKRSHHEYDGAFFEMLREYALEHYTDHDLSRPYLVEFYNAVTGEPLSSEPDYNHSYFIDLIVQHVAGVCASETGIRFDPCRIDPENGSQAFLTHFALSGLRVRGHQVDVFWDKENGYQFFVDSRKCSNAYEL